MSNKSMRRSGILMIILFFISLASFSQFKDVQFLRSAPSDGALYLKTYFAPWANAFGSGLNGGWYNTAKPHKLFGFDITTNFSVGVVPTSAQTFDVSTIGLSSSLTGTGIASTIAGPKTTGPLMTFNQNGDPITSFNSPKGSGLKYIPVPMAQVGFGLPLGTEVKLRFIPKVSVGNGNVTLWGVGLVHSLVQYLPGNKLLPFDVSLFGGYTKLQGNIPLSLQPDPAVAQNYTTFSPVFSKQNLSFDVSALNISLIASLNLPVVTLYGGLGYCKTSAEMKVQGNFPTPVLVPAVGVFPIHTEYNDSGVVNGAKFGELNMKNYSGLRANIGLRFKFSVITLHFDYTKAQYNVYTAGLGVSFR